jgi:hypothetical protein
MDAVEVKLPGGVRVGEQWHRCAWLRPVSGREEEFLLFEGKYLSAAARATQLLTRCVLRLGPVEPVGADLVRRLNAGDREALLFHIRRLTCGEHISCLLSCANCNKKMDLDLQIAEFLLPPYPHSQEIHEVDIDDSGNCYRVRFRVPNGEDQEAVASAAEQSVNAAEEIVLRRCIERVDSVDGGSTEAGSSQKDKLCDLPDVVLRELPARMAALDPQAEILLDLTCPECAAGFIVPFDAGDYFFRELALHERELYREVHALSLHYHWSEDAALGLSRRKRQTYFELLADDLTRGGRSV